MASVPASSSLGTGIEQSVVAIVAWSVLYITMMLLALSGNVGICWLVARRKKLRTVTNFFLSSTAFTDSQVIVLNTVFNFTYAINDNKWIFGRWFCHFINFLPVGAVCASILLVAAISVDRFVLVIFPMRRRIKKSTACLIIFGIWMVALCIAFPQAYYAVTEWEEGRTVCYVKWPSGEVGKTYQILFHLVTYWLPLTVIALAYMFMGQRLGKEGNRIGNENETQRKRAAKNKKAVRMMTLVVLVFAVCWLPYQLYFIASLIQPSLTLWKGSVHVYLAVFWLAMSHAMFNPVIYCWANPSKKRSSSAHSQPIDDGG